MELDRVGAEGGGELGGLLVQHVQNIRIGLVGKGDDDRWHPGIVQGIDHVDLDGVSIVEDVNVRPIGDNGRVVDACAERLRGWHACGRKKGEEGRFKRLSRGGQCKMVRI